MRYIYEEVFKTYISVAVFPRWMRWLPTGVLYWMLNHHVGASPSKVVDEVLSD